MYRHWQGGKAVGGNVIVMYKPGLERFTVGHEMLTLDWTALQRLRQKRPGSSFSLLDDFFVLP